MGSWSHFFKESFSLDLFGQTAPKGSRFVPNFFHSRLLKAPELLGTFRAAEMFLKSSPDLFLYTVQSSELWSQFFCPHGFYSDIISYYGLKTSCRNISEMIKRNGRTAELKFKGQNKESVCCFFQTFARR